jgi:cephalosporin hydroxylase
MTDTAELMARLPFAEPIIFVDCMRVNIDDLIHANPGNRIVRVKGDPRSAVHVTSVEHPSLGCVAGWISEGD